MNLWGFISPEVCGLVRYPDGANGNSFGYIECIEKFLPLRAQHKPNGILQQDNVSFHRSQIVRDFMEVFEVPLLLDWPAWSPDLNLIENIWGLMQTGVNNRIQNEGKPVSSDQLFTMCFEEFNRGCDSVPDLYRSMRTRLQAVVDGGGEQTKY